MRYSPWADLRERPHICCDAHTFELPHGGGWWLPDVLGIVLDRRMTRVERRCALAHELRHVDHGDEQVAHIGPDGPRLARRQEARADREAARRLVTITDLVDALLAHPQDGALAAEQLDVTEHVLRIRLVNLEPAEAGQLRDALEEEQSA